MKKSIFKKGLLAMYCIAFNYSLVAQQTPVSNPAPVTEPHGICGTKAPDEQWENWFQSKIAEYKQTHAGRATTTTYTVIPVVVHILYKQGNAAGTAENLAAAQVQAQIDAVNDMLAGLTPGNSSLPAPFAAVDANDIPIRFCLAVKDNNGNVMPERGIDRVNFTAKGWSDPASLSGSSAIMSYFDNTVKPATIWDPAKYFNMWVGDYFNPTNGGLLGYATFPASSTLPGITSNIETATTSGVVMASKVFGDKGKYANGYYAPQATYTYGITTGHEVGHYLGLRHISGDAACGDDYCADTPPQKGGNGGATGGQNWGCPTYPFQANGCSGDPNGEMFENYMDYSDDQCRSLYTADQATRMLTAMANAPYRKNLGNNGLCSTSPSALYTASQTSICPGASVKFTDNSANNPTSWNWTFTGGSPSTSTLQNPTVTYSSAGNYNVKLVVKNSQGADSLVKTQYIVVNTAPPAPTTTGAARCSAGIVNLSAAGTSGNTINWYTASTGGTIINTGTTYSPSISTTTTYYVEQVSTTNQNVGPVDHSFDASGGYYNTVTNPANINGEIFDVLTPLTIKSVDVYADSAGSRTIEVLDTIGGTVVKTITVNLPAGKSTVNLNFDLQPKTNYFMKVSSSSARNGLYRNNGGKATYPYTISGVISITETNQAFASPASPNFYYFFYNWVVQKAGCSSPRTAVTGTINSTPATPTITQNGSVLTSSAPTGNQWYLNGTLIPGATNQNYTPTQNGNYTVVVTINNCPSAASSPFNVTNTGINQADNPYFFTIYPNPSDGNFNVSFNVDSKSNYKLEVRNVLGQIVYKELLNDFSGAYSKQLSIAEHGKGIYLISLTNNKNETVKKVIVY